MPRLRWALICVTRTTYGHYLFSTQTVKNKVSVEIFYSLQIYFYKFNFYQYHGVQPEQCDQQSTCLQHHYRLELRISISSVFDGSPYSSCWLGQPWCQPPVSLNLIGATGRSFTISTGYIDTGNRYFYHGSRYVYCSFFCYCTYKQ